MNDIPVVKLTLEYMQSQLMHAFSDYQGIIKEQVEEAVKQTIANFDFKREVEQLSNGILRDEIRKLLVGSFQRLQYDGEFKEQLVKALLGNIRKEAEI
jgi:hypothetical protein